MKNFAYLLELVFNALQYKLPVLVCRTPILGI